MMTEKSPEENSNTVTSSRLSNMSILKKISIKFVHISLTSISTSFTASSGNSIRIMTSSLLRRNSVDILAMLFLRRLWTESLIKYPENSIARFLERCHMTTSFVTLQKLEYNILLGFCLSEEDKTTDRSIEYWFKVVDLDGNDMIT